MRTLFETRRLEEILASTSPVDYRGCHEGNWPAVFAYIEQRHFQACPDAWRHFLASVRKRGVHTPVLITWRHGHRICSDGHHRLWAAHKFGLSTVPVREEIP